MNKFLMLLTLLILNISSAFAGYDRVLYCELFDRADKKYKNQTFTINSLNKVNEHQFTDIYGKELKIKAYLSQTAFGEDIYSLEYDDQKIMLHVFKTLLIRWSPNNRYSNDFQLNCNDFQQ
jgi:hypothetical protein